MLGRGTSYREYYERNKEYDRNKDRFLHKKGFLAKMREAPPLHKQTILTDIALLRKISPTRRHRLLLIRHQSPSRRPPYFRAAVRETFNKLNNGKSTVNVKFHRQLGFATVVCPLALIFDNPGPYCPPKLSASGRLAPAP